MIKSITNWDTITNSPGIYSITCLVNNKVYIGYSNEIRRRLRDHRICLINKTHYNTHLQNSWNLYKEENFLFEELELCEEQFLTSQEHHWATLLKENLGII